MRASACPSFAPIESCGSTQWRRRYVSLTASYLLFAVSSCVSRSNTSFEPLISDRSILWGMGVRISFQYLSALKNTGQVLSTSSEDNAEWIRCSLFIVAVSGPSPPVECG